MPPTHEDEKSGDHAKQAFDLEPIHHPRFGFFLKAKADPLGLEVVLTLRKDEPAGSPNVTRDQADGMLKQFGIPKHPPQS